MHKPNRIHFLPNVRDRQSKSRYCTVFTWCSTCLAAPISSGPGTVAYRLTKTAALFVYPRGWQQEGLEKNGKLCALYIQEEYGTYVGNVVGTVLGTFFEMDVATSRRINHVGRHTNQLCHTTRRSSQGLEHAPCPGTSSGRRHMPTAATRPQGSPIFCQDRIKKFDKITVRGCPHLCM